MSDNPKDTAISCEDSEESMQASEALCASRATERGPLPPRQPIVVSHIPDPNAKQFAAQLISRDTASEAELIRSICADGKARAERPYWQKPIKKVVVTLNIGDYNPAIRALTYPLMEHYARKIGAEFREITERKNPHLPCVMEKSQCRDIIREESADWVIFFDADALISPEMFDVTSFLNKDTVCFNGKDMSALRSRPDKYFLRDGRYIGACSWFMVASDWTADDLWHPLDDIDFEQAKQNMFLSIQEHNGGQFKDNHLIDDYVHSRNIARFGIKHRTLTDICGDLGWRDQHGRGASPFFWHQYSVPEEQKIENMLKLLSTPQQQPVDIGAGRPMAGWQIMDQKEAIEFRKHWRLKA